MYSLNNFTITIGKDVMAHKCEKCTNKGIEGFSCIWNIMNDIKDKPDAFIHKIV